MQIHELNNYGGALDSGAYLAIDNGEDTGKVSASGLLQSVESEINELDSSLNARIDNIIAGGTAPSAAEVTDARLGASDLGSVQYNSLGEAIRGQATQLNDEILKVQDGVLVMDLIPNSYVTTQGVITYDAIWSRTDYLDIGGYTHMTLEATAGTGSASQYNCFYDENKQFISSFSTPPAGTIFDIPIPDNAKYVIFSNAPKRLRGDIVKFFPNKQQMAQRIGDISEEAGDVINGNTSGVTLYGTNGYMQTNDGAFIPNNGYQCYYFTMPKTANVWYKNPTGWNEVAAFNGDAFDTTKLIEIRSSSRNTLPTVDQPLKINSGMTVAVCVPRDSSFVLFMGNGTYVVKTAGNLPKIIITPVYATSFYVDVLDEGSGKYLRHWFYRNIYSKTLSYGEGQTKEVLCGDIWHSNNINDENGNLILQGNTNFIHYLDIPGHTGHVGAGHGCVVQDFTQFYADGKLFDPATLADRIICDNFKFITRADHYLIDTENTESSSEAVPTLDENGDPIVTSKWTFVGEWSVNNRIKMRNQLKFVYDGIRFVQCHAGMLCGFYPITDNVMLQGPNTYIWNSVSESGGVLVNALEGNTDELLLAGGLTSVKANTAYLYGDGYIARQTIEQMDPAQYGKNNILANMPPNGDSRMKMYLQPCVCTSSTALTSEGVSVDEFNTGDYLDVLMERAIDLTI